MGNDGGGQRRGAQNPSVQIKRGMDRKEEVSQIGANDLEPQ